ncbi:RNB domain-containing ribonuclease [Ottowia sp. SB7-C50]|uniref:RNB domain-containing ribonuclease n=1 Tax=Ottowia sp. SB7-C50 TaxID=3081231 RepID=UPI002953E3B6|nr:RNB domain-containing ribonuclease [Ottowia sp. SB7-C50]WOP16785.1 RNB domain-containing ribonuclease [Ottowia sp. SB7-C50]
MNNHLHPHQKQELADLAVAAMRERGLEPEFPKPALEQLKTIDGPSAEDGAGIVDMTGLLWCSIDNDDSRDLDQITVSEVLPDGHVKIMVAIADVDTLVAKDTPIDRHAQINTTSVYTSARIFPMLPEKLSTDFTSLNPNEERVATVTEMVFAPDGEIVRSHITRARVHNKAKLAYDSVAAWLEGNGPLPEAADRAPGMDQQLRTQDSVAQQLRARRREQGSLEFQTFQPRAEFDGDQVVAIKQQVQNRARQLIEEFMVATNGVTARFLAGKKRAAIRRVVKSPERWARIAEVAAERGWQLPPEPNSAALEQFLAAERKRDPLRFPDLSLIIVKLMGRGEYVVERPGGPTIGHFGLAVRDYSHSTAPNRRYPDLITSRLIKAALADVVSPYSHTELEFLANHCTKQEDAANKVERQLRKSEAAMLLESRIGDAFDGVVTGSANGNQWVRIFNPPAEGKLLVARGRQVKVGDKVRAKLLSTHVERGFIDFEMIG